MVNYKHSKIETMLQFQQNNFVTFVLTLQENVASWRTVACMPHHAPWCLGELENIVSVIDGGTY